MKICCKCKQEKDLTQFNKNKSKKDGLGTECKICMKELRRSYRSRNREKLNDADTEYRGLNKASCAATQSKCYHAKREQYKARTQKWADDNREESNLIKKSWRHRNPGASSKDRASKLERTPKWVSEVELHNINELYKLSKILTKHSVQDFQVDHILPLKGDLVSGLHTLPNLQILTKYDNTSKNNRFEID